MKKNSTTSTKEENIQKVEYQTEMKQSFIDFAMTVIVQRALPDIRDGLKPVHRRILYAMKDLGMTYDKPFKKSARITGEVIGKYHPHGDTAVYETMVRLSQDFNMRYPLVEGHGNFGSIDGDNAAAMRYTEARLSPVASEILSDLEKDVVDFQGNYDNTEVEPVVLPSKFPHLLVNGVSGIAVGMKTDIPPHHLGEIIKAIVDYIDHPDITIAKLMKHIKGPDFPTGGIITNKKDLLAMYETGKGKIRIRAKIETEDAGYGKTNIVVTEIPFTLAGRKAKFIENLEKKAREKKLEELSDIRDESSKDGLRLVLEVKKGVSIEKFINKLYSKTDLEDTYSSNFLAIVKGKPEVLNLKEMIVHFVDFQKEITRKKYKYLLEKAIQRHEILSGLIKAHDILDLIIEILRGSKDVKMAKACLMSGSTEGLSFKTKKSEKEASKLDFTEAQTDAILDMRLQKLISLEIEKLTEENDEKMKDIELYQDIINNEATLLSVIKDYLKDISKKHASTRKTIIEEIETVEYEEEFKEEELYALIDRFGYVKTIDVANFNRSNEDTVKDFKYSIFTKNTDKICMFTKEGNLHSVKMMDIPKGKVKDKGIPIDTLVKMGKEEILLLDTFENIKDKKIMFTTKQGMIKIVRGIEFETNRKTTSATKIDKDDEIVSIQILEEEKEFTHVVIVSDKGFALKLDITTVPEIKKGSKGVKTITLTEEDYVTKVMLLQKSVSEVLIKVNGREVNLKTMKTKKRNQLGVKI